MYALDESTIPHVRSNKLTSEITVGLEEVFKKTPASILLISV